MGNASETPLFSIITVTYNSAKTIVQCLETVAEQTCTDYEHLVIDGASKDGTASLVSAFSNSRLRLVSEPDKGIYDAMNKGIGMARGHWLCFLNSDDYFSDSSVLSCVQREISKNSGNDLFYGKALVIDEKSQSRLIRGKPSVLRDFYKVGTPIIHQAVFFNRDIFDKLGRYDLNIPGGAADWAWFIKFFASPDCKGQFLDRVLVCFRSGGASFRFGYANHKARCIIAKRYFPTWVWLKYILRSPLVFFKLKLLYMLGDSLLLNMYRRFKFATHSDK